MTLTESEFEQLAAALLARLAQAVEEPEAEAVSVELQEGVLTIEVEDKGTFLVSRHGPTRQIWLSSPLSGASHYAYRGGRWCSTRDETELLSRLAAELAEAAGVRIELG